MKKFLTTTLVSVVFSCTLAFAHHAADGVVDDEIYEQIGELLEDSQHADMSVDDLASGSTSLIIEIDDAETFDQLVDDGLLQLINDLEGNTTTMITETTDDSYSIIVVNSGNNNSVEDTEDSYYGEESGSWDDAMNQNND